MFGLPSTQEQLAAYRDDSADGVALVYKETCIGCYLQDHHNRDGEALFGVYVDGTTTRHAVMQGLRDEIRATGDRIPDYVSDDTIKGCVKSWFADAYGTTEEAFAKPFNASLESPAVDEEGEVIDNDDAAESCQAWFVLTWTHKPYVAYDIHDAAGHLVHSVIVTDEERESYLSDYNNDRHVWTETGRYTNEEAEDMTYNDRGLASVGEAAEAIRKALAILEQVDFSVFPGLYDAIPWKRLERIAS